MTRSLPASPGLFQYSLIASLVYLAASCGKKDDSQPVEATAVHDPATKEKIFVVSADGSQPMLDDLEDGDLTGLKHEGRHWNWEQFDDMSDGIQVLTIQKTDDAPSHGDSVLYVKGGDWKYSGAGVSVAPAGRVSPRPYGYYDASVYQGIRFWVKSVGIDEINLVITTPESLPPDEGGTCLQNCPDPFAQRFPVGRSWTEMRLPFSGFKQPDDTAAGSLNPGRIKALRFSFETLKDYEVWLDDLAFY